MDIVGVKIRLFIWIISFIIIYCKNFNVFNYCDNILLMIKSLKYL